ncbi:putative transposase like protein [Trichonephila clavipes]|nr:putative transposase like protein [Trichonephila clavipes]
MGKKGYLFHHVCLSDESTFEILQNKAQLVRRRRGESFILTVKHPTKIMILSVISGKSTEHLYVVKGMMRQDHSVYQGLLAEQNIPLLDWPGNSPDMNAIENVLQLMKREVAKYVITNKTQLLKNNSHVESSSSNVEGSTALY